MKRRDFVRKSVLAAGSAASVGSVGLVGCAADPDSGGAAAVQTNPRISWRIASSFPRSLDTIFGAADVMSRRVSDLTGGRFTVRVFPAGELVPYDQVLESVQKGTIQMGHSASYYFTGLNPALAFDCTVPFGLTSRQFNAWMYHGDGLELTRRLFSDFNVINFPGGNTGIQMGGWFRRPVGSVDDLRGLKMRIPGMGGKVMSEMGVNVQVLAGGDIYPSLERGAIDATEWVGPYDDEKLGFYQVAANYYYPGWWEPGPGLSFYVNLDAWNSLPSDYQAAIAAACAESNVGMLASYDAKNPPALARLLEQGVQLQPFARDIMESARRISTDLMAQDAAADAGYRAIHDSCFAFRDLSDRWLNTAEYTYSHFVHG